jgi:hypothetical protein
VNVDEVLLEVRKAREAYAQRFGYDLLAIHRDLKEQERASGGLYHCPQGARSLRRPTEMVPGHPASLAEPTPEADRGCHLAFPSFNVIAADSAA